MNIFTKQEIEKLSEQELSCEIQGIFNAMAYRQRLMDEYIQLYAALQRAQIAFQLKRI
jgi:hypothetical protein